MIRLSNLEVLESGICDVINIRLKRRDALRNGIGNQSLDIKTAVERPISKLGIPNFRWSLNFILLLVTSLLFRLFFMTSHMPLSSASNTVILIHNGPVVRQIDILPVNSGKIIDEKVL